jgi:hypothetical protein
LVLACEVGVGGGQLFAKHFVESADAANPVQVGEPEARDAERKIPSVMILAGSDGKMKTHPYYFTIIDAPTMNPIPTRSL